MDSTSIIHYRFWECLLPVSNTWYHKRLHDESIRDSRPQYHTPAPTKNLNETTNTTVEAIYDGEQIKMPEINIHRPCKVIITFLEGQSEEEEILDVLLMEDPAFEFLKSEDEDIYNR